MKNNQERRNPKSDLQKRSSSKLSRKRLDEFANEIHQFIRRCENKGVVCQILFSIGIGSLASWYFIVWCLNKLGPLSEEFNDLYNSGIIAIPEGDLFTTIYVIFKLGILCTILAPLLNPWSFKLGMKTSLLFIIALLDVVDIAIIIAVGEISPGFIWMIWISFVYTIWFCIEILRYIYDCMKSKKTVRIISIKDTASVKGISANNSDNSSPAAADQESCV